MTEFVKHLNRTEKVLFNDVIRISGQHEAVAVDIAMQWNEGYSESVRCYANGIYNLEGGTHLSGFRSALTRTLNAYGKNGNLYKDFLPQGEDFREGLSAIVTVRIPNPQFESQTKIKLVNAEVDGAVAILFGEVFSKFLEENPTIAKSICTKSLRAAEAREAAKKARDLARNSNKIGGGGLPEKLRDCRKHDLAHSELYLVEGDSAGGSADTGRDSEYQAILPLRGKILNVEKAQLIKVLANAEVAALFKAIGIAPLAEEADIAKRRYGKIILMTDADVDGSHIRALLLTFIFRHMRELMKQGCVYVARPPLYRVLSKRSRKDKPRYVQTHEEMMSELLELGLSGSSLALSPRPDSPTIAVTNGQPIAASPAPGKEEKGKAKKGKSAAPVALAGPESVAAPNGQRKLDAADLRRLAELMGSLTEPLETLERRGINLRTLATKQMTPQGLLPRFRAVMGVDEHWFATKSDLDVFLLAEQERTGKEIQIADEHRARPAAVDPNAPPAVATPEVAVPVAEPVTQAVALQLTDLHEIRAINDGLSKLYAEFHLTAFDLLPAPMHNAEPVFPYCIESSEGVKKMKSLRELVPVLRDLGGRGLSYTRFKGLGEMNPNELFDTSMDPKHRILKQVTLRDAAAAEEIFRVLMGENAEPRREFIEKHALEVQGLDV